MSVAWLETVQPGHPVLIERGPGRHIYVEDKVARVLKRYIVTEAGYEFSRQYGLERGGGATGLDSVRDALDPAVVQQFKAWQRDREIVRMRDTVADAMASVRRLPLTSEQCERILVACRAVRDEHATPATPAAP